MSGELLEGLVIASSPFDRLDLHLLSALQDLLPSAVEHVSRRDVAQGHVIALVVVVAHKSGDCRQDGTAVCWGDNSEGKASPPQEEFVAISSGGEHTCALREDGNATCWGDDDWCQASPPEGERFVSIVSFSTFTCGVRDDGVAVCWGNRYKMP